MEILIYQVLLSMYSETNSSSNHSTGNTKDEQILTGRLTDLANMCYNRNIPVFSSYLNLNEQNIFHNAKKNFPPVIAILDGGYDEAERKLVTYLPYEGWEYELPVNILKIESVNKKFSQGLSHRDFLGALMNLGIDRSLLGDIVICDQAAYLFCLEKITDFIVDNLIKVKHDMVSVVRCDNLPDNFEITYREITGSVASLRLDAVISLAFNESRSKSVNYIENALVFVNGRLITTNAYNLKPGEIISVRGLGRFKYIDIKNETKKGRLFVILHKYE